MELVYYTLGCGVASLGLITEYHLIACISMSRFYITKSTSLYLRRNIKSAPRCVFDSGLLNSACGGDIFPRRPGDLLKIRSADYRIFLKSFIRTADGRWVRHKLTNKIVKWQMPFAKTRDILLARYKMKSFLNRTVTGDERRIYFDNPKCKKSWVDPGAPSTSSARPSRFGGKTKLHV